MTLDEQLARHARVTGRETCDMEQLVEDVERLWNAALPRTARPGYPAFPRSPPVRVPDWESPDHVPARAGWVGVWLRVILRYRGRADDPWLRASVCRPGAPPQLWLISPYHVKRATFPLVADLLPAMDALVLAHQLG